MRIATKPRHGHPRRGRRGRRPATVADATTAGRRRSTTTPTGDGPNSRWRPTPRTSPSRTRASPTTTTERLTAGERAQRCPRHRRRGRCRRGRARAARAGAGTGRCARRTPRRPRRAGRRAPARGRRGPGLHGHHHQHGGQHAEQRRHHEQQPGGGHDDPGQPGVAHARVQAPRRRDRIGAAFLQRHPLRLRGEQQRRAEQHHRGPARDPARLVEQRDRLHDVRGDEQRRPEPEQHGDAEQRRARSSAGVPDRPRPDGRRRRPRAAPATARAPSST